MLAGGGSLRGYQLGGVRFLLSLVNNRVNGILADEMVRAPCMSGVMNQRDSIDCPDDIGKGGCCAVVGVYESTQCCMSALHALKALPLARVPVTMGACGRAPVGRDCSFRALFPFAAPQGLGKTIQTIALLAHLAERKGSAGPHLVLAPKARAPPSPSSDNGGTCMQSAL
jgi:hypothetical protein